MVTELRRNSEIKAIALPRPQVRTDHQTARKAQELAKLAEVFRFTFLSPRDEIQQPCPDFTIRVAPLRIDSPTDAKRYIAPNGNAYEITVNERWLGRSRWEVAEVLLHQMLITAYATWSNKNIHAMAHYHTSPLLNMADELGLHLNSEFGRHFRPAEGQFEKLMAMLGIEKPKVKTDSKTPKLDAKSTGINHWWEEEPVKGNSTLKKFVCGCDNVRYGGQHLEAACLKCKEVFRPEGSDEKPRTIEPVLKPEPERPHLDALNILFTSSARTNLLQTFFSNTENGLHVRELTRRTGLEINAVRRELANFEKIGLVSSHSEGNKKVYALEKDSSITIALSHLFPALTTK